MNADDRSFHAQSADEVLAALGVRADRGLSKKEVESRREEHGPNRLQRARRRSAWKILLGQFKSIVIILLAVAGVVAFATQRWPEGFAIVAVVVVNTAIGFFSEWKAVRSMEALRAMQKRRSRVRRGGSEQEAEVHWLVPGDIVLLEEGDLVPADIRLVSAEQLRVNEAALTGESVPAGKTLDPVDPDAPLAERSDMLFKGTTVSDGSAEGVVVATGMQTELGRISQMAEEAEERTTPLQERLDRLGRRLAWITIGVAIVVAIVGLIAGKSPTLMIETAIALGVAAIPEGLPIVATIALARGMWIMARRNALINRLTAVETLGATRVIFTDKTGTLTENRMTLRRVLTPGYEHEIDVGDGSAAGRTRRGEEESAGEAEEESGGKGKEQSEAGQEAGADDPLLQRVVEVGVLCNGASLGEGEEEESTGDPTEVALLQAGRAFELSRDALLEQFPEQREVAFDPEVKMMATYHQSEGGLLVAVKGAPAAVLDACERVAETDGGERPLDDETRQHWLDETDRLAADGLRVLAVAEKTVESDDAEPYEKLRLVGLVGLLDPPREEVRKAIEECQRAGIRVVMVTGDQPETGRAIGKQVGIVRSDGSQAMRGSDLGDPDELTEKDRRRILETDVFARVSPEQKLNLIRLFQDQGETVAMTGDGVNDAPALKKADIGVAMGRRGTDAARQVSDMILQDDSFASIVAAVRQGRVIFGNIRKSVIFMLCTNIAEVLIVTLASLVPQFPIPLRPLQILYLNVLTDVFPALALGVGKGSPHVMDRSPRDPRESVLTGHHWTAIASWSGVIAACVLAGFTAALLGFDFSDPRAVTISFLTLAFSKLWFVFNLRDAEAGLFDNDVVRNPWIWGSLVLCASLLLVAVYVPGLSGILETVHPGIWGWVLILGLSLVPAGLGLFVPGIRFHGSTSRHRAPPLEEVNERLRAVAEVAKENRAALEELAGGEKREHPQENRLERERTGSDRNVH